MLLKKLKRKKRNKQKRKNNMFNLIAFLLFNQSLNKESFLLIDKDLTSFSKPIREVTKEKPIIKAVEEQCVT